MTDTATLTARLAEAEAALHDVLLGKSVTVVGYDGKTVTYNRTSVGALRSYIVELNRLLGKTVGSRRPPAIGMVF